ncbi:phosphatase PAP2 family protein [Allokutzneria sp. A3M-2-11 16]|uniref:phosphatase PAP2 family protein n=1 Tax=Allokutzneria sp. A3M-2-11 16 TaxID=2962043 RepID=UPI0020B86162|nr:phosphatase PAP2 family protein [Allokutzneria sp. A3M-2-11 16]MCP3803276.1 phosphatase PAP2 family protein [Allokutzneria sp. A3M-2-11 16]
MTPPDISVDWYRAVTEFAAGLPGWVRALAETATTGVLALLAMGFAVAWLRSRTPQARAVALLAPAATVIAYLLSETAKSLWQQDRPCRAVSGTIAECPPLGDWSFPSNHATLAGAAAVGLIIAWRRAAFFAVPAALLEAASRVIVGVHYPHDVLAGLILGGSVAALVVLLLRDPLTRQLTNSRRWSRTHSQ